MKQLLILNRDLSIKQIMVVNDVIPVRDIVSPQKTTFEIQKNDKVVLGDLIVLKRENDVEYIGVVQDLETQDTTKIASFPLINITDMDFSITNIQGSVFNWIKETFTKNFVETQDTLLKLPLTFQDKSENINLNYVAEDGNLFDVLLTLFKKYGIYLSFSLDYDNGKIASIVVIVNRASETNQIVIRYDNPIIFEKPNVEKSQAQDTNKVIFKPDASNKSHKDTINYYLLDNNTVTKDATAEGRINGVVQAIATYTDNDYDNLQSNAESLLVGDVLNHQITLKVLKNASYDFDLYSKVKFIDKDKIYDTYVTRIEDFNDKYIVLKLGTLRLTLTDKIKALEKAVESGGGVRSSGSSGGGGISIAVVDNLTSESSTDALSAKQGKVLKEITDLTLTNATINNDTGIFTFTRSNGTTFTIDTLLEKVVTNFTYNETTKSLELTLEDGTVKSIPMTAFIDDYSGVDGEIVTVTISNDNKISATIKNGTIALDKLTQELQNTINNKVDKITGKGLSTNDYTIEEKQKLAGLSNYDDSGVQESITNLKNSKADKTEVPTKTSQLINDGDGTSPFATENYVEKNGGKIDVIKVNGVVQPIENKTVNIPLIDNVTAKAIQLTSNEQATASVTRSGSSTFNFTFGIPQGQRGLTGSDGKSATIKVRNVSTLPAGSNATVTNVGTTTNAVFDFGIPQGDKGDTGGTYIQLPLGVLIPSTVVQDDDAGLLLADGSEYPQTGIYSQFATWLKEKYPNGDYTNDKYLVEVSKYGQCGHYVIDNTKGTFRVPRITQFVASSNGGQAIGSAELDSFKSHSHAQYVTANSYTGGTGIRQDYSGEGVEQSEYPQGINTGNTGDTETKPKNIRYPYYIVVATGVRTDLEIDINKYITDLTMLQNNINKKLQSEEVWSGSLAPNTNLSIDLSSYKYVIAEINLFNSLQGYVFCDISANINHFVNGVYSEQNSDHRFFVYGGEVDMTSDRKTISFNIKQYSFNVNTTYIIGTLTKIIGVK